MTDPDTTEPNGWFSLSSRALFVVAGVVAVVVLVVVWSGVRSARTASVTTVTGAPAAPTAHPSGGDAAREAADQSAAPGPTARGSASAGVVVVHVAGAVARPGLVQLATGSRVAAAIDAAGGASDGADVARVNLARPLVDGEQLYVPSVGEETVPEPLGPAGVDAGGGAPGAAGAAAGAAGAGPADAIIDLNTADEASLQTLPGIGPALAARIVAWRTEHGGFRAVEDLLDVSGIGDARFAELQPRVRV